MKISWVILTYNRGEIVEKAIQHNFNNKGFDLDEIIWVDNGSTDNVCEVMKKFNPDISICHSKNLGVAKGYNRGFLLATGDWIVITGCDMLMPNNWLKTFVEHIEKIPNSDVIAMYSQPINKVSERVKGDAQIINGLRIIPGLPIGRRIMRRDVFEKVGFLREDFGLYGWEDVEWAERCLARGLFCYNIPFQIPEHLGTEGIKPFDGMDAKAYHKFKQKETQNPKSLKLLQSCRENNYPYYNFSFYYIRYSSYFHS